MSVRLKFPRGSTFSFLRQFIRDGSSVDVTGATFAAYLKSSAQDSDAAALASLSIAAVLPATGIVRITIPATATAAFLLCPELFWQARATLSSGLVCAPEKLQGPVMLTPFLPLYSPENLAELTPEDANDFTALTMPNNVTARTDITSAALHRAVVTLGVTLPWILITLESGDLITWSLRALGVGEVDDSVSLRRPTDWNATTNNVIWVRAPLT